MNPLDPANRPAMVSNQDIAALLKVFDEPVREPNRPAAPSPEPRRPLSGPGRQDPAKGRPQSAAAPAAPRRTGPGVKGLISCLVGTALIPIAILFVLLWQDMMRQHAARQATEGPAGAASLHGPGGTPQSKQVATSLEVVLTSPERIEARAGETVAFPLAIDATEALPLRSIVAVTGMPEGASFSAGRPFGDNGWSLRPHEIGDLQLHLAPESGTSLMRLDLVAGDGTVLARSQTRIGVDALPPVVAKVDLPSLDVLESPRDVAALHPFAQAAESAPPAEAPPPPQRKPVAESPALKVNKVKVVTITPPQPKRPHDGAYALGSPADEAQAPGEWMETKTAVDMHAKAQQSSETVKVAEGGVKMRVLARDKRWIQVIDPETSTTGWIYDRFLKPTDPPAP
jgi:hypothetical protein